MNKQKPEVLFITSYPPRECGIATYSQDLIHVLENKFSESFSIKICALESKVETFEYDENVIYRLHTSISEEYIPLANSINQNNDIHIVVVEHEFGFFQNNNSADFLLFLNHITKPIILGFHTVLPRPNADFRDLVFSLVQACVSVIVMTYTSKGVLEHDYNIDSSKIEVIPHGTHLVSNTNKTALKEKYNLEGRKVLTTFGLISSGKSFETTIHALPQIVEKCPEVMFLIIGKTHPEVVKTEGETYRTMLKAKVAELHLENNVLFINQYLSLPVLLEYLRLTDIYLFTSNDPNQAVSGTFSYAMSCGCPIISTPFPQAREMLDYETGVIIEFGNSLQLATEVILLLQNETLRKKLSLHTLHKIAPSAWENSAIAHAQLFQKVSNTSHILEYSLPPINCNHINQITDEFGMFQFSKINQPDESSGYTLDDNARALISMCMHYEYYREAHDLALIEIYLNFIEFCLQPEGNFLNYVDTQKQFTPQNYETNLEDSNGRALWALGYLISHKNVIPEQLIEKAQNIILKTFEYIQTIHSSRAMGFCIKGLYLYSQTFSNTLAVDIINEFAHRLLQMFKHEAEKDWHWFESYLTYANSILPESLLLAWKITNNHEYLKVANITFEFLLQHTFSNNQIKLIPNQGWLTKGGCRSLFGEQPIDVAYTILALHEFYIVSKNIDFKNKITLAFSWFLGNNHLCQIVYNPCTGGCYDGLEQYQVNLNQGAESTVSYLMSRMIMQKITYPQPTKL